jgi:hypothetical protein
MDDAVPARLYELIRTAREFRNLHQICERAPRLSRQSAAAAEADPIDLSSFGDIDFHNLVFAGTPFTITGVDDLLGRRRDGSNADFMFA